MLTEMYLNNTFLSISLIALCLTFQNKFPEIFDDENDRRPHIVINADDKAQIFLFLISIVFVLFAPVLNFIFAICYTGWIMHCVLKSRKNK